MSTAQKAAEITERIKKIINDVSDGRRVYSSRRVIWRDVEQVIQSVLAEQPEMPDFSRIPERGIGLQQPPSAGDYQMAVEVGAQLQKDLNKTKEELAYVKLQRDKLLEIAWLDLPSDPTESTNAWREQFNKGWIRRAVAEQPPSAEEQIQEIHRKIQDGMEAARHTPEYEQEGRDSILYT